MLQVYPLNFGVILLPYVFSYLKMKFDKHLFQRADFVMEGQCSFLQWLREWGNRPSVVTFWAVVGCVCSFCYPFFLGLEKWQAVGNLGHVRLKIMLHSCAATAAVYRVGFVLRHHKIMRVKPTLFGFM